MGKNAYIKSAYLNDETRPHPTTTRRHIPKGEKHCELCGILDLLKKFEGLLNLFLLYLRADG